MAYRGTRRTTDNLSAWTFGGLQPLLGKISVALITVTCFLCSAFPGCGKSSPPSIPPASSGISVLEPETWVGKDFALLSQIDIGDKLSHGRWTVVLYYDDCPYCQEAVPKYEKMAKEQSAAAGTSKLAFVEIPPYNPSGLGLVSNNPIWVQGKLSEAKEWFVATPVRVELADGKVVTAEERATFDKGAKAAKATVTVPPILVTVTGTEGEVDLGFIKPKAARRVIFSVSNPSGSALEIRKASSECPCMTLENPPKALAPKAGSNIEVLFVAPEKPVHYSRRVALLTTDSAIPGIFLRIKANVGLPVEMSPAEQDFGTLVSGESRLTDVTIANNDDKDVRPVFSTSSIPTCTALLPAAAIPPKGRIAIPIRLTTQGMTSGAKRAIVTIHTDAPDQSQMTTGISYAVSSAYRISEGNIDIGTLSLGQSKPVTLELTSTKAAPSGFVKECTARALLNAGAEFSVKYAQDKAIVDCSLKAGDKSGPISGYIELSLLDHVQPVRVYVTGQVAGQK